jgi:hypothetical protein
LQDAGRPEQLGSGYLVFAFDDSDDADSRDLGDVHEHQADGPCADDDHGVAGFGSALLEAANDTGQRFSERGVLEGDIVRDEQGILFDDASWNTDELGVGPVVEQ